MQPALLGIAGRYCGCCCTLPWESIVGSQQPEATESTAGQEIQDGIQPGLKHAQSRNNRDN
jgi:hypothetical protein